MSRPKNLTTDEAEIWQRMEQHGEELVRDMGAAMMQAERLPEWMQEAAVNMLCDKLVDARALAAYLADRDPGVALTDGAVIRLDENEHTKEEEHGRAGHL